MKHILQVDLAEVFRFALGRGRAKIARLVMDSFGDGARMSKRLSIEGDKLAGDSTSTTTTPLHLAASKNLTSLVTALIEDWNVTVDATDEFSRFHRAPKT